MPMNAILLLTFILKDPVVILGGSYQGRPKSPEAILQAEQGHKDQSQDQLRAK